MASTASSATEKQDEIMSKLRTRLERTQRELERVTGLLDGITTPVREIFSQNYDARIQLDGLTARMIQLEENSISGMKATRKDMCDNLQDQLNEVINAIWNQQDLTGPQSPFREGPTLVDRVRQILDEKMGDLRSLFSTVDIQVQSLNKELERLKTTLSDHQEKFEGEQRVEILKIRSEVQSKTGMDEQK
eukprot:6294984-Amphidinium_carterae.1